MTGAKCEYQLSYVHIYLNIGSAMRYARVRGVCVVHMYAYLIAHASGVRASRFVGHTFALCGKKQKKHQQNKHKQDMQLQTNNM